MNMIIYELFLFIAILFVSSFPDVNLSKVVRKDSESEDMKIDNIMHAIQGICIHDNPDQTVKQLRKDTQTILNNIGVYKEVVKLNKQLRNEIKWIIEESKGHRETRRIIDLLKRDAKDICSVPKQFKDCTELKKKSHRKKESGVYMIYPGGDKSVKAYCDMTTDGGGWTIIQRRYDGSVSFNRKWLECENGFGNIDGEFWFGNKYTHMLTSSGKYELRVDVVDIYNKNKYALYKTFIIGDAASKYKLTIGDYSGNAGNGLKKHNGHKFSTTDQDNDIWPKNCSSHYKAPWWYYNCYSANLNLPNVKKISWDGINFKSAMMMIRKI